MAFVRFDDDATQRRLPEPEIALQRVQSGGLTRLERLLAARASSSDREIARLTQRHGKDSAAAHAAQERAKLANLRHRAATIDRQRIAVSPQPAGKNELVLIARLVDDHDVGIAGVAAQLSDPTGTVVAKGCSDAAGYVRLAYYPEQKYTASAEAEVKPTENSNFDQGSEKSYSDNPRLTPQTHAYSTQSSKRDHRVTIGGDGCCKDETTVAVALSLGVAVWREIRLPEGKNDPQR